MSTTAKEIAEAILTPEPIEPVKVVTKVTKVTEPIIKDTKVSLDGVLFLDHVHNPMVITRVIKLNDKVIAQVPRAQRDLGISVTNITTDIITINNWDTIDNNVGAIGTYTIKELLSRSETPYLRSQPIL